MMVPKKNAPDAPLISRKMSLCCWKWGLSGSLILHQFSQVVICQLMTTDDNDNDASATHHQLPMIQPVIVIANHWLTRNVSMRNATINDPNVMAMPGQLSLWRVCKFRLRMQQKWAHGWGSMGVLNSRKSAGLKNLGLSECFRIDPLMLHWQLLGAHVAAQNQEVHWSETIPFWV